jgi:hypothetical protein
MPTTLHLSSKTWLAAALGGENPQAVLRAPSPDVPVIARDSLPPDSPWLYAHARVVNPTAAEVGMYWWTDIAVPDRPGLRVLAPAAHATYGDYGDLPACPRAAGPMAPIRSTSA